MKKKETITIKGSVKLVLKGPDGTVKKVVENSNLVTTVGKTELAILLANGAGALRPTHIAVGTNNTAPVIGDTALATELFRKPIASTGQVTNKVTYTVNLLAGEATGLLEEAGLFNAGASGDMWARFLTGSFNKGVSDTLDISWSLLFT